MKCCKKTAVVEAYRFTKATFNRESYPLWLKESMEGDWENAKVKLWSQYGGKIIAGEINTSDGEIEFAEGDYIVREISGEIYSYEPDIFHEIYDEVLVYESNKQHANQIMSLLKTVLYIILGLAIILTLAGFNTIPADDSKNYELKTETYIVQRGDILDEITDKYMLKNTYDERGHDEFKQGIKELNMDNYPYIRYGEIKAGDRLQIHYWIRKD